MYCMQVFVQWQCLDSYCLVICGIEVIHTVWHGALVLYYSVFVSLCLHVPRLAKSAF